MKLLEDGKYYQSQQYPGRGLVLITVKECFPSVEGAENFCVYSAL